MSLELSFTVQGSGKSIYNISVVKDEEGVLMTCSCPAGRFSGAKLCKHRLALLQGDITNLIDIDHDNLKQLRHIISDANSSGELDRYFELCDYVLAYNQAIAVIPKIESLKFEPKFISIEEYEQLLLDGKFSLDSTKSGIAYNVFDLYRNYYGSLKTRRGVSKIPHIVWFECRSDKYEKEHMETTINEFGVWDEVGTGEMFVGWHMIGVNISLQNPIYKGIVAKNEIKQEIEKLAKLFC